MRDIQAQIERRELQMKRRKGAPKEKALHPTQLRLQWEQEEKAARKRFHLQSLQFMQRDHEAALEELLKKQLEERARWRATLSNI